MQARKDNLDDSIYQMLVVHSVLTVVANSRTQHVMLLSDFIFSPGALKVCTSIQLCHFTTIGISFACNANHIFKNQGRRRKFSS